jgi:hypothetical protein
MNFAADTTHALQEVPLKSRKIRPLLTTQWRGAYLDYSCNHHLLFFQKLKGVAVLDIKLFANVGNFN